MLALMKTWSMIGAITFINRITSINQIDKVDPFDYSAVFDIQTGNNSFCQHAESSIAYFVEKRAAAANASCS